MEMYTQLCMHLASLGYVVVALEHEDGSGAYAEAAPELAADHGEGVFDLPAHGAAPVYFSRPIPQKPCYTPEEILQFRGPHLAHRLEVRRKRPNKDFRNAPPALLE